MKQKEIDVAAVHVRFFLAGVAVLFDANFHELEEMVERALNEIEESNLE